MPCGSQARLGKSFGFFLMLSGVWARTVAADGGGGLKQGNDRAHGFLDGRQSLADRWIGCNLRDFIEDQRQGVNAVVGENKAGGQLGYCLVEVV